MAKATPKKSQSTAVVTHQEESKITGFGGPLATLMQETSVTGFEEASSAAYAIPFLRVLQDLSPQVKTKMSGYIKGAKPGQILNTASKEVYDRIRVVPCYFQQTQIEWVPRNSRAEEGGGAGFVTAHPANTPLLQRVTRDPKTNHNILPNGNELMDTRSHYVLLLKPDGATEGCLLPMSATSLKVSRQWMTQMKVACAPSKQFPKGLPMFSSSYELWTEEESNAKGQWYKWMVGNREPVETLEVFEEAQRFAAAAAEGSKISVNYNELRDVTHERDQAPPKDLDNEIDA